MAQINISQFVHAKFCYMAGQCRSKSLAYTNFIIINSMTGCGRRVTADLNPWTLPFRCLVLKPKRYSFMRSMFWPSRPDEVHPFMPNKYPPILIIALVIDTWPLIQLQKPFALVVDCILTNYPSSHQYSDYIYSYGLPSTTLCVSPAGQFVRRWKSFVLFSLGV